MITEEEQDYQAEPQTMSPAESKEPSTGPGDSRKTARAFSLWRVQLMRCAILRLMSLGLLSAEPHMARDSVETHAMVSHKAEDHPPPQASKTSGRKEAPRAATCAAVFWKEFLRDSTYTSATVGWAAERREGRRMEETEKSQASGRPEISRGTHTSAGRRPVGA